MSENPPEPDPFPWLPLAKALEWTRVQQSNTAKAAVVADVRLAACEWVEDQRPDLRKDGEFQAKHRTKVAARLVIARLVERQLSPFGFVSFEELGGAVASIGGNDPDVRRMLGRPRPRCG